MRKYEKVFFEVRSRQSKAVNMDLLLFAAGIADSAACACMRQRAEAQSQSDYFYCAKTFSGIISL